MKAMLDPDRLEALAKQIKELAKAQRDSLKAADRMAAYEGARTGARGGKRTSLDARWETLASYRDRLLNRVEDEARSLFGLGG
jgi:hypothetical protein